MTASRRDPAKIFDLGGQPNGEGRNLYNKIPLRVTAGMIHMHCDNCGIGIAKHAAWAKR